jgi:hypothetical protein
MRCGRDERAGIGRTCSGAEVVAKCEMSNSFRIERNSKPLNLLALVRQASGDRGFGIVGGIAHVTPKSRSSDFTLINRRALTFVHSISPLFILL